MRVRMAAQSNSAGDTIARCPQECRRRSNDRSTGPRLEQCKKKWFCYRAMRTRTVALVLCALAIAACKKPSDQQQPGPGSSTTAAAVPATGVLIGATLPLTGSESRIGGFFKEGYELAFEQATQSGGISVGGQKMPVRLTLLDDTSTQATAASLADRLINSDKVHFLLGTYATNLVEAQSVVAEQNNIPYVNGGGAATAIYKRGYKWVFGLLAPVELLAESVMKWVDAEQQAGKLPKPASIALLWENTSHGKDFRKGITEFADKTKTYKVTIDESFELNGKDFSALLGKVNVEHVISAVWWSPLLADKNPEAKKFVDAFKAKYGVRSPEWYQALGFETARSLFTAIEQAGSIDRKAVREKLAAMKIPSLLPGGELTFPKEFGQQTHAPFVVQQNMPDGTAPIVAPADSATAKGIAPNPSCPK